MKFLKTIFLFFCALSLFQVASCTKNKIVKVSEKSTLDSVDFYIKKMNDATLGDSICLNYSNKALSFLDKSDPNSKKTSYIFSYKIYLFGNLKQYDSAIYISKKLLQKSKKANDSISLGLNYTKIAYYYARNQQNDSAYYYYNLIKNEFLKYNDSITNGNILLDMAIIEKSIGDYISSEYTGSLALKYLSDKNSNSSASVYNNWAISSKEQGQLQDALIFYEKAIELTTINRNKIIYKNNIASTYRYLGDYNTSILILDSLAKDITITDIETKARIIDNLAYTKWLANNKENALPELEKALEMRMQEKDFNGLTSSYDHLSKYFENINPNVAISYASKMYDVAIGQKNTQDQLAALQKLIALDNSEKAKEYYSTYIRLNDSLQNSKDLAQHKFAKIRYESDKNQKENLNLKIAQSTSKLEIEKQKSRNTLLFTSGSSIFLSLLIFIYYKKKKYQIEKRTEVYNTEKRISKKLHDEVANNVVNIMNKVQYTKNPKEELLDDLEKVYLLTRNISHENNAIETGENFDQFLKSMLSSFSNHKTTVIIKNSCANKLSAISKEKQIELYRILQELMVNMSKHSNASLVAITCKNDKDWFYINYSDNGIGFNLEELKFKNGLKNVETRIKSINGTLTFDTKINNGFKVFISFKN